MPTVRRDGRVVDYTGLENRRTERCRGFESLSLRKTSNLRVARLRLREVDENPRVRNRRSRLPEQESLSLRFLMKREPYGFLFLCLKINYLHFNPLKICYIEGETSQK